MVEKSEFKGKPIIILKRDEEDKYPFSFGLSKARLILENWPPESSCTAV